MKSDSGAPLGSERAAAIHVAEPTLPNFFLVGAPKTGTTSLYHYLDQHPEIYMSPIKEPHFFAEEIRLANFTEDFQKMAGPKLAAFRGYLEGPMEAKFSAGPVEDWDDYVKLFRRANGETAIGEASVCYLWSRSAARNIARACPGARILMILRDPVERAFSNYLHMLSDRDRYTSFRMHVDAALNSSSARIGTLYPFLEFGRYCEQVRRYFDVFPRDRIGVYFYEDFVRDPKSFVQEIFKFLEVAPDFEPDLSARRTEPRVPRSHAVKRTLKRSGLWELARAVAPEAVRPFLKGVVFQPRSALRIDPVDRARLLDYYREDIPKLEGLLDRDLGAWLRL